MPRLDADTWGTVRAEYEAGASMSGLAKKHQVNKSAISRKAEKEAWTQDPTEAVDRLVNAKINGVGNAVDPQKKAEALDAAADRKVAVIRRHQAEWDGIEAIRVAAIQGESFDKAKLAKIASETLMIKQGGERKAWGLDKPDPAAAITVTASASATAKTETHHTPNADTIAAAARILAGTGAVADGCHAAGAGEILPE